MTAAFENWDETQELLFPVPDQMGVGGGHVLLSPELVVSPGANRRYLVLSGKPATASGEAWHFAEWPISLGVIEFTRRDRGWIQSGAHPDFDWVGGANEPGTLRSINLGVGRAVVAAEGTYFNHGHRSAFIKLYHLHADGGHLLLAMETAEDSEGNTGPCSEFLEQVAAAASSPSAGPTRQQCDEVKSEMRILEQGAGGWPDIEFQFSGRRVILDQKAMTSEIKPADDTLRLRYRKGRYVPVSGTNPIAPLPK